MHSELVLHFLMGLSLLASSGHFTRVNRRSIRSTSRRRLRPYIHTPGLSVCE